MGDISIAADRPATASCARRRRRRRGPRDGYFTTFNVTTVRLPRSALNCTLLAGLQRREPGRIPDLEHHRHRGHVQVLEAPMLSVTVPALASTLRTSPSLIGAAAAGCDAGPCCMPPAPWSWPDIPCAASGPAARADTTTPAADQPAARAWRVRAPVATRYPLRPDPRASRPTTRRARDDFRRADTPDERGGRLQHLEAG